MQALTWPYVLLKVTQGQTCWQCLATGAHEQLCALDVAYLRARHHEVHLKAMRRVRVRLEYLVTRSPVRTSGSSAGARCLPLCRQGLNVPPAHINYSRHFELSDDLNVADPYGHAKFGSEWVQKLLIKIVHKPAQHALQQLSLTSTRRFPSVHQQP